MSNVGTVGSSGEAGPALQMQITKSILWITKENIDTPVLSNVAENNLDVQAVESYTVGMNIVDGSLCLFRARNGEYKCFLAKPTSHVRSWNPSGTMLSSSDIIFVS